MEDNDQQDRWKHLVGEAAVTFIEEGMVIGLGSGTTATQMIYALGHRIQEGLRITGAVATSHASEDLARKLTLQSGKTEAVVSVALEDKLVEAIAQSANSVIEDDWIGRAHHARPQHRV